MSLRPRLPRLVEQWWGTALGRKTVKGDQVARAALKRGRRRELDPEKAETAEFGDVMFTGSGTAHAANFVASAMNDLMVGAASVAKRLASDHRSQ